MLIVDLDLVAYVQASGNYCRIMYVGGQQVLVSLGLAKIEELIRLATRQPSQSCFVRLGRSLIINQRYLYRLSVTRQKVVLSDYESHIHELEVTKAIIRQYKDQLSKSGVKSNN